MNRREMIKAAGSAAAMSVLGIPLFAKDKPGKEFKKRKILVIGAHPDDPETGAGGTMCLLTAAGHEVVCVYLTRGEAGIPGKTHAEAAAIRVKEAEAACKVTGARHIFMDQIDGNTEINLQRYKEMRELFSVPSSVWTTGAAFFFSFKYWYLLGFVHAASFGNCPRESGCGSRCTEFLCRGEFH